MYWTFVLDILSEHCLVSSSSLNFTNTNMYLTCFITSFSVFLSHGCRNKTVLFALRQMFQCLSLSRRLAVAVTKVSLLYWNRCSTDIFRVCPF